MEDIVEAQDSSARPIRMRAESVQRLQIGSVGLAAMLLLVGLANVIMDRARESEAAAVPDATATEVSPEPEGNAQDPLVDMGVVPEVAPSETPAPAPTATLAPTQPDGAGQAPAAPRR